MYVGDDIVISTGLAIVASRRLRIPLIPLATALILLNMIDFDHLLYFYKDTGTANSLTLHPLHIYAGCLIFAIFCLSLVHREKLKFYFCLVAGITIHLSTDLETHAP